MMWIYQALDIITTFSQSLIIFVMGETLCRKPRAKFSRWMPPVIITATTFLWTWFIVDATYKLPCVLLLLIILYMLCYKVSIRNSMIAAFMSIVFVGTIEIISNGIAEIFQFPQAVLVDDIAMAPIPIYLVCLSLTVSVSAVLYLMFRNFRYRLNNKDFIIVLLFEIVAFLLYHISVIQKIKNNLNAGFDQRFDMLLIVISVSFAVVFLYIKNNYYLKEQEQQSKIQLALLERQYKYYQDKQKDEERVCSLYHDMKNHLLLLEGSQGTDAMHQMAEQLRSQIAAYEDYIHTGNRFLDVIIKDKAEKMREKKIDFSVMIDFGGIDFIKPLDISTLFGNGIDNAIEASEKLPQEERIILVKAGRVRDFVSILIENNCIEEEKAEHDRTSKPDDFLHGFGIPNMQKSAEKYGGTCITVRKGGKFALKILLPVKED